LDARLAAGIPTSVTRRKSWENNGDAASKLAMSDAQTRPPAKAPL